MSNCWQGVETQAITGILKTFLILLHFRKFPNFEVFSIWLTKTGSVELKCERSAERICGIVFKTNPGYFLRTDMAIHSLWKARLSFFSCFGISLNCVLRLGMMGCAVLEVSTGIQALKSFQLCPRLVYKQHSDHLQILENRGIMNVSKTSCILPLGFEVRQEKLEGSSKLRNYIVKQVDF